MVKKVIKFKYRGSILTLVGQTKDRVAIWIIAARNTFFRMANWRLSRLALPPVVSKAKKGLEWTVKRDFKWLNDV